MEKANKNGTTTRKLCNFLPYLTNEVEVDDGVEQTRSFRIAGIHESGRMLPEIEVTVKEFEKMNWVLERWGADCVIEPGKLISGINCSPESALDEFRFVKRRFHKEGGRSYYHIVQSFSPDDDLTPETAHEIGLKFAEYFPGFQIVVATHVNTKAIHNHLIMNSVSYENGKMFHQSRNEMLQTKEYSNQLCREYGLSVTEVKTKNPRHAKWKRDLLQVAEYALGHSATKEEFIEYMREHGYKVKWEDRYKYITFTSPEGWKVRDNKLFDERFLKDNLEIYFALGGCDSAIIDPYFDYVTPNHPDSYTMTYSDGLINLLGDLLSTVPDDYCYQPQYIDEMSTAEKERIEKILGRRICNEAFYTYCTREDYEREQGISM